MKNKLAENVSLEKLVHGGQCLAETSDGKKIFVWGGLPGELVNFRAVRSKKNFAEGYVEKVLKPSKHRIHELSAEDIDLSIQPWSIMDYNFELKSKEEILRETFKREGIKLPSFKMETFGSLSGYRNKVEFSFWGDEDGLHYAHYLRASHKKVKLVYPYSELIFDEMMAKAEELLTELRKGNIRAGDLKSVIIRSESSYSPDKKVAVALFVKTEQFPRLKTDNLAVFYSNPKSPASLPTNLLYANGDITLRDTLLHKNITYDVLSFFQVNVPVFLKALETIKHQVGDQKSIDMYSGVGAIGISVGASILVESDRINCLYAKKNAAATKTKVIHASAEEALDRITEDKILIVDPPRAGLHRSVVEKIIQLKPPKVIYLSCNPSTQARDIKMLSGDYKIAAVDAYNFFPRTPHIESLVVLELK